MGYNDGTGILTYPFTKIAANGNGDLQRALGTAVKSEIQLVGDVAVDNQGNVSDAHRVNIKSKFKPFKHSTILFSGSGSGSDREAALQSVNLGYNIPSYRNASALFAAAIAAGAGNTLWSWDKPVSGQNPLRALDFDGYGNQYDWPYQLGITPNPAYYQHKLSNAIEVSDADAAAGLADWDASDLKKEISLTYGGDITIADAFGDSIFLAVAYAPVGQTTPTAIYTLTTARHTITAPSASATYNAVTFFTNIIYNGTPISTDGIHIPAPLAYTVWNYYNYFPFQDNGSFHEPGVLSLGLRMRMLASLSYTSLGVQFSNDGSNWSSTVTFRSSSGTLYPGDIISTNVNLPSGYLDPQFFRMVWNGNADTRNWAPQTSPTD